MYKNILIITDNLDLSKKFNTLIIDLKLKDTIKWSFGISAYSDKEQFKKIFEEHVDIYDLKDEDTVAKIIANYDLVFSLHCKQLFPNKMVNKMKCINIHPGYNPINRGWYPQVFAIINHLPIGATIHEIDNKLDHGAIIARKLVDSTQIDTSETLYNKIIDAEIELLKENLAVIIANKYSTILPENEGKLYLKQDFNDLCKLNLDEKLTTLQFIDKFRALTHGSFQNAFFIDPKTEKKVFAKITLEYED